MKKDKYNSTTSEDYTYFDIESDPKYENLYPGTVTIEGFGLECWDYEWHFGKPHDERILVNCADVPDIPAKKLLRRLHEFRMGGGAFGWNPQRDCDDLEEFTKGMGYVNHNMI